MGNIEDLIDFDPDSSPASEQNTEAAEQRGLRFDNKEKAFVDEDGCLIRDRYGQQY